MQHTDGIKFDLLMIERSNLVIGFLFETTTIHILQVVQPTHNIFVRKRYTILEVYRRYITFFQNNNILYCNEFQFYTPIFFYQQIESPYAKYFRIYIITC